MRLGYEDAIAQATALISDADSLVSAVVSGRLSNTQPEWNRIDFRVVLIRGERTVQSVRSRGHEVVTVNLSAGDVASEVNALLKQGFSNITVTTTSQVWQCRITRRRECLVHMESRVSEQELQHDRAKSRMLDESDPFLISVGISTAEGKVKPSKRDKYLQVDDFLRVFAATLDNAIAAGRVQLPSHSHPLRVIDLGCGHAYLTFAVQAWAERVRGWQLEIVGVDRRESSVTRNNELVHALGIESMTFTAGDIAQVMWSGDAPDVVLALHACDTATDDALAWAVNHQASVVLAAPCCHHRVHSDATKSPESWTALTRHGILRERLLDGVTDAARAAILRAHGYKTDVFEFVGGEHTPRNIMIRGVRTGIKDSSAAADVTALSELWGFEPVLLHLLDSK